MHIILSIISYSYIFNKYVKISDKNGYDERIFYHSNANLKTENTSIIQILKIAEKEELLEFLESNICSNTDKLDKIYDNTLPSRYNITEGGLFDDWNFEM